MTVKLEPDMEDISRPLNEEPRSLESNRMPEQAVTGINNRYSIRKISRATVLFLYSLCTWYLSFWLTD